MAYSYSYLGLVNRVLSDFNEVQLDSTTFSSAMGFQGAVKNYVNDAINDIYLWQDGRWPFLWDQRSFTTTIGEGSYIYDSDLLDVDWDSFEVKKPSLAVSSLNQVGGLVTAVVPAGHQLIANDSVEIRGATPTDYNGDFNITIVSSTVFTYTISNTAAASPANGTIISIPPYNNFYLTLKNYDEYNRNWRDVDVNNAQSTDPQPSPPRFIIRKPDNNFILSPYPDRIYTIGYDAFINPDITPGQLSAYTDVPLIPSIFRQVIIDRASIYCLAFRDNDSQLLRNDKKFDDNCHRMRRHLIKQDEYITFKN